MNILLVFLGGGIGSVLRYVLNGLIGSKAEFDFPYGILAINIIGSFLIGIMAGYIKNDMLIAFVMIGILGGFTTFSAFSLDAVAMFNSGRVAAAFIYIAASVIFSLLAAYLGVLVSR